MIFDEINIKITGEVEGGSENFKRKVLAELEAVCARYDLELEEE